MITGRAQVSGAITPFKTDASQPLHFVPVQRNFSSFQCLLFLLQMECLEGVRSWLAPTCTRTSSLPRLSNASGSSSRNWHAEVRASVIVGALLYPADRYRSDRKCLSTSAWVKPAKEVKLSLWRGETLSPTGPLFCPAESGSHFNWFPY